MREKANYREVSLQNICGYICIAESRLKKSFIEYQYMSTSNPNFESSCRVKIYKGPLEQNISARDISTEINCYQK